MTIKAGFGGQPFVPEHLSKVARADEIRGGRDLPFRIQVDGGIKAETASLAVDSGADVLVAGSAIFHAPDPRRRHGRSVRRPHRRIPLRNVRACGRTLDPTTHERLPLVLPGCVGSRKENDQMNPLHESTMLVPVTERLERMDRDRIVERIWRKDHTVWRDDPTEIANRLGWLTVVDLMHERIGELEAFATQAAADGFETAVLLGMGGSSLAPEVFVRTFGVTDGALELIVLDTTHPADDRTRQRPARSRPPCSSWRASREGRPRRSATSPTSGQRRRSDRDSSRSPTRGPRSRRRLASTGSAPCS